MSASGAERRKVRFAVLVLAMYGGVHSPPLQAQDATASSGIRIQLGPAHEVYRDRIVAAADESLTWYTEWLGPLPLTTLTIAADGRSATNASPATFFVELPWRSAPAAMDIESQVAYGIALQWWSHLAGAQDIVPMAESLSWYLQSRVVERLFNARYFAPGHSTDAVRFFGGNVAWTFPSLRFNRWTAGLGRDGFLRRNARPDAWPAAGRRLPSGLNLLAVRGALGFGSLERYLGWPVLQGALHVLAARIADGRMTRHDAVETISAAAGQDLSWFFDAVFDPTLHFDYAVDAFATAPASAPCPSGTCYRTDVTVARRGNGEFTGASREPEGQYEAGEGLGLQVTFADGQVLTTRWDGRSAHRTFEFESPASATSVRLDPEGTLLLDANPLDHGRNTSAQTNVPIGKWVARWMVWLQDAMLAYAMLF